MQNDNKLDSIELKGVDIEALRNLFGQSLLCDSKLGFTISPTGTIDATAAGGSSFFKKWRADLTKLCENYQSTIRESAKVFIYDGSKFCNNVLSTFGKKADIKIQCKKIQDIFVAEMIVVSNNQLTIRVICSALRLGFVELSNEEQAALFSNTTNLRELSLSSEQFKILSKFGSLNMLGKTVEGIELKTTEKGLVATDGSFDYVLDANYGFDLKPISLHKALLKFIDGGHCYDVKITTTTSGNDIMTLRSKEHELIMTMALMTDSSFDINNIDDNDEDLPF